MSEVIHALHESGDIGFGPEDIAKLITGFESARAKLGLTDRNDPARRMARAIQRAWRKGRARLCAVIVSCDCASRQ